MAVRPRMQIEGVRELNRLLRQVGGRELQKELGQVHKSIGEMVIARLGGRKTGIGSGRGETIRPSAATREVQLRVGGSHRASSPRRLQWGRVQRWPGGQAPHRPSLIQAANDIQPQIEREYLDGVDQVIRRVGLAGGAGPSLPATPRGGRGGTTDSSGQLTGIWG